MSLILIVDDSPTDRLLCRSLLKTNEEYRFLDAECGIDGYEAFAREAPDCVILDQDLPDIDGLEVLSRIRSLDTNAAIVMLTGGRSTDVVVSALRGGAADYLDKNRIDHDEIHRSVSNALEKRSLRVHHKEAHEKLLLTVSRLRMKNAEMRSFYHSLSHELRTPLTSMQEALSVLLDKIPSKISMEQRGLLAEVHQSCEKLGKHIDDLLDVS